MKVLLTGATGITGIHILNSLKKTKHTIITFSRNPVDKKYSFEHRMGDLYSVNDLENSVTILDASVNKLDASDF